MEAVSSPKADKRARIHRGIQRLAAVLHVADGMTTMEEVLTSTPLMG